MMSKAITLLVGTALLLGCNKAEKTPMVPGKVVCVLFDLSGTTNKPEIRKAYIDDFKIITERLTHGDAIVVALITEFSAGELRLLFQHQFPPFEPGQDKTDMQIKAYTTTLETAMQHVKDSLRAIADSVLMDSSRRIMRTDIMTSLQVAERVLNSSPQPRKILVILSDMVEDSDSYNFEREDLTESRIRAIIEREKRLRRVPNLAQVRVYCIGAFARNAARYERIKAFWSEYFTACGAVVTDYGAALVSFNE